MNRLLITAAALALTTGTAFAQDAYAPPAEDDVVTGDPAYTDGEDELLYEEDGLEEPQGDANDDEGEALTDGAEEEADEAEPLPSPYGDETYEDGMTDEEPTPEL